MKLLVLLLVAIPFSLFVARNKTAQQWIEKHRKQLRTFVIACSVLILVVYFGIQFYITHFDQIFHDEASILSIAAAVRNGQQMYPLANAPVEYGLLYGPTTYLSYIPPMVLGPGHIGVFLAWGALALVATLLFVGLTVRRVSSLPVTLCSMVVLLAYTGPLIGYEWALRGDVWVLLFGAVGLWAAGLADVWLAAGIIAIVGGLLTDIKAPLLAVAILPNVALWERGNSGRRPAVLSTLCIPLLALLPFASKNISLAGYRQLLADASHHGLSLHTSLKNLPFEFFLLLPLLGLLWIAFKRDPEGTRAWLQRRRLYLWALAIVFVISAITGTKFGAGPWHLMAVAVPLVELEAELFTYLWSLTRREGAAYLRTLAIPTAIGLVMLLILGLFLYRSKAIRVTGPTFAAKFPMPPAESELQAIVRRYPGQEVEMGYTDLPNYNLTSTRPLLQLDGKRLFLDAVTRNEADLIKKPLSPNVLEAMAACSVPVWVLPAAGEPFSLESEYYMSAATDLKRLYPEELEAAFVNHYRRTSTGHYYSVWVCNKG